MSQFVIIFEILTFLVKIPLARLLNLNLYPLEVITNIMLTTSFVKFEENLRWSIKLKNEIKLFGKMFAIAKIDFFNKSYLLF